MTPRAQSKDGTTGPFARPREGYTTGAGDWSNARLAGKRLPEHLFPEELEAALAQQRMEQLP